SENPAKTAKCPRFQENGQSPSEGHTMRPRTTLLTAVCAALLAGRTVGEDLKTVDLVRKAQDCVYRIQVFGVIDVNDPNTGKPVERQAGGTGSGFAIEPADGQPGGELIRLPPEASESTPRFGYVVTNAHVVSAATGFWKRKPEMIITGHHGELKGQV